MMKRNSNIALYKYTLKKLKIGIFLINPMNLDSSWYITTFIYQTKQKCALISYPFRGLLWFIPFPKAINPITYGGGNVLAKTISLLTITLKWFYLAPPNLVTFCFCPLDTFWQNFSKIDSPGRLLQLFLKWIS